MLMICIIRPLCLPSSITLVDRLLLPLPCLHPTTESVMKFCSYMALRLNHHRIIPAIINACCGGPCTGRVCTCRNY
ncbi:expressed protein [Echinococcus multilocularis]|uniref:Expressed protein n=1 Tax=Echinococcus multilocularis TaxID=6211 RepID=A0A068YC87_ECHMU|nr:expressed protein [Echinococcus multilocularis]